MSLFLAACALNSKIKSDPATRSGKGDPCQREAQIKGAPSATIKAALELIDRQVGIIIRQHHIMSVGRDKI